MSVVREAAVTIGEPDLVAAQHLIMRSNLRDPRRRAIMLAVWIASTAAFVLLFRRDLPESLALAILLMACLTAALSIGMPLLLSGLLAGRLARRNLRTVPAFGAPLHYSWSEEGFSCITSSGHSFQHWNSFHRWLDGEKLMLIWSNPRSYQLLPKRAFTPDQIDDIRRLLSARSGT